MDGGGERILRIRSWQRIRSDAWCGSWGGGMPQWHWPAWGYMPSTPPETPVAGDSLPERGTSKNSKRPQDAVDEEDEE